MYIYIYIYYICMCMCVCVSVCVCVYVCMCVCVFVDPYIFVELLKLPFHIYKLPSKPLFLNLISCYKIAVLCVDKYCSH